MLRETVVGTSFPKRLFSVGSKMKICIITLDHPSIETRIYHKLAISLAKIAEVSIISRVGISSPKSNPSLHLTDTESRLNTLWALYRKCRKIKPDIIICIEPWTLLVGRAIQKKTGAKLVYDIHEYYADAFAEKYPPLMKIFARLVYLVLEHRACAHADLYIAVNKLIVKKLLKKPKQRSRSIIIPNYPARNTWSDVCELGGNLVYLCETDFDLVYIGGLSTDHGTFKLLKAISLLKREISWLKVLMVGRFHFPEEETRFLKELNDYNLNAIVFYQKWIAPDKIGVLLRRSKVGIWMFNPANQRFRKAIPLKLLEYYAAGLPVIATKSFMMNELISQNHTGLCVEYKSTEIAAAIKKLLRLPPAELKAMGQNSRRLIEEKYNWERLEPLLLDRISTLISENPDPQ